MSVMALRKYVILRRLRTGRLEGRTTPDRDGSAYRSHRALRGGRLFLGQAEAGRQAAHYRGSGARPRIDRNRAAVQFDEALEPSRAEPGARFARVRVAPPEFCED